MPLDPGTRLGSFEIITLLGSGGMGDVYKALDAKLNRTVALKHLPAESVSDTGRRRRFVQEAQAASALDHPNIITIHDVTEVDGHHFIVMQYVAGKTLRENVGEKGLDVNEALRYAVQIADGLAAAHAKGIVHRDLKPDNVMVDEKGQVKILDFGLAKLVEPAEPDEAPTRDKAHPLTQEGHILGTVAYMSPEQAQGKKVDARSDIFSFGSVLYEMLTGKQAFSGDNMASVLASIIRDEPESVSARVSEIPPNLERVVDRCLRKDPERRFHSMADVRVELEEIGEEADSGRFVSVPKRRWIWGRWVGGTTLILIVAVALTTYYKSRTRSSIVETSLPPMRTVPLTSYPGYEGGVSFSPDGSQITFGWGKRHTGWDIWIKLIGPGEPLRLTTGGHSWHCAWSPDGRFIAFLPFRPHGVSVIPALGGRERRLAETNNRGHSDVSSAAKNLSWSPDSRWLALPDRDSPGAPLRLFLLSVETGEKRKLTFPPDGILGDVAPAFSPDGRALAFKRVVTKGVGDLCLIRLGEELEAIGEPYPVVSGGWRVGTAVWSPDGDILFSGVPTEGEWDLWRIRNLSGRWGDPERHPDFGKRADSFGISHDGTRIAYTEETWDPNIWMIELPIKRGEAVRPVNSISSTRAESQPQFSPDGSRIAFFSDRSGTREIWVCDPDGSNADQLTQFGGLLTSMPSWSPDGEHILFGSESDGQVDIYRINANGGDAKRLTEHPAGDYWPWWSRDSRWIFFSSARSGTLQIWKMPAEGGEAVQLTRKGGDVPRESPDGRFVYYVKSYDPPGALWRVPVDGGEEELVLDASIHYGAYAVVDRGIYFAAHPGPRPMAAMSLQFSSFETEKIEILVEGIVRAEGITVSPDDRWLLYTEVDFRADLMLVENFRWPDDSD
jgi:serine/threonine protein kinase/sugar lactone lactonase YvrE